jgi:KipI family sensor histidine kinase inhibitor
LNASIELRDYGTRAYLVELEDGVLARRLAAVATERWESVQEVVPGHRTVLLSWKEDRPARRRLEEEIVDLLAADGADPVGRSVNVPVTYDGADLEEICRQTGLDRDAVIAVHSEVEYEVAFVGFMPGFAYLIGGDPRLAPKRRSSPRTQVPPGSVAVAGPYSAIYPMASPGGWNLLGRTTLEVFDPQRPYPALLRPGDRVRFEPL